MDGGYTYRIQSMGDDVEYATGMIRPIRHHVPQSSWIVIPGGNLSRLQAFYLSVVSACIPVSALHVSFASLSHPDTFALFIPNSDLRLGFVSKFPGPYDTIRDFPEGKIGVYTRLFEFANFRLPISNFLLGVLLHFGIHISQFSVLGVARASHFEIICRAHGRVPTVHLSRRFYLASNLPTGGLLLKRGWFTGKDFPRDSTVDGIDGDIVLESLLNDNPTQIRRYAKAFLILIGLSRLWYPPTPQMRLQNFIKVANPFDVVCGEEKLLENEKPIQE
ncbi:hypothetical protein Tco_0065501 [Tanacetum coccineum]